MRGLRRCAVCQCLARTAGHGSAQFLHRQRLLALCGWSVQRLRPQAAAAAAGPGTDPTPNSAGITPAADAAIACALCGAKAGLWQFVPRMAPASSSLSGAPQTSSSLHSRSWPCSMGCVQL